MWIKNKEKKWYKRNLRLLGWPSPRKLRDLWRITRFRSWTWHQSSLFSSIELHPCKKIQWSCKNTSSLQNNTNENLSLEENLTWYLYKMIRNHTPWMEEAFPTKIPWIVEHIPRFSQSFEFQNLCNNSIIYCLLIIYYWFSISRNNFLNYILLQLFIICPIFS